MLLMTDALCSANPLAALHSQLILPNAAVSGVRLRALEAVGEKMSVRAGVTHTEF